MSIWGKGTPGTNGNHAGGNKELIWPDRKGGKKEAEESWSILSVLRTHKMTSATHPPQCMASRKGRPWVLSDKN